MTFARWNSIKAIDCDLQVDYKAIIRAHLDYALMALLGLDFTLWCRCWDNLACICVNVDLACDGLKATCG